MASSNQHKYRGFDIALLGNGTDADGRCVRATRSIKYRHRGNWCSREAFFFLVITKYLQSIVVRNVSMSRQWLQDLGLRRFSSLSPSTYGSRELEGLVSTTKIQGHVSHKEIDLTRLIGQIPSGISDLIPEQFRVSSMHPQQTLNCFHLEFCRWSWHYHLLENQTQLDMTPFRRTRKIQLQKSSIFMITNIKRLLLRPEGINLHHPSSGTWSSHVFSRVSILEHWSRCTKVF